tara:strand:- start:5072 stop:6880 length:1809 start_codon:yes stop_codon:yes gene_type:complete
MASQSYKILISAKDKASASFRGLSKVAGTTSKVVGGLTKGVAAAGVAFTAASVAVAAIARSSFEFADAIGKVSTRTGIATDTVQAFQIAAVESGSSVEIANKSLEKFTRSVGDAQRGLKTQADIFKDLGVSITDANGATKTMDVLLREVSDGMAGLQSQSEKATVAANLFGRAGIQIVDILDNGGASFDAFIDKAKDYGLILSESGIRQSEKFNDTLAFINRQFKTATAAISIAFLPILQHLATAFKELTASTLAGDAGVMKFGENIRDKVLDMFDAFLRSIADTLDSFHQFRIGLAGVEANLINTAAKAENAGNALAFMAHAALGNVAEMAKFAAKIGLANNKIVDADEAMQKFAESNVSGGDAVRGFADDLQNRLVKILGENNEEVTNLVESYKTLFAGIQTGITDLQSPLDVYEDQLTNAQTRTKDFETSAVNAFKKAEDALVNFVKTGKLDFKDLIDSLISDLIRFEIRQSFITPMFEGFKSSRSSGKGFFTSFLDGLGSLFGVSAQGGGFTGMGARAGGIDGKGGFPAILHPNETIIDHHQGQSGGVVINQSLNFATGVQDTVRNEVLQMLPDIAETSKNAVAEAMQRGGSFRRTMR